MDKPVPLNEVAHDALTTLELAITDTNARVQVDDLPTVLGDAAQLSQLFQNLISNALKFHQPGVAPQIYVRSQQVAFEELPPTINPTRRVLFYHRIAIIDNGIGFEEKYLDRIFQVFQRLHGKNHFSGTGIGLAICEKVVANHGGAITASSQPDQGATFFIYLPA